MCWMFRADVDVWCLCLMLSWCVAFELVLTLGVILYIILYLILYYYTYTIIYLILYSSILLLFFLFSSSYSHPVPPIFYPLLFLFPISSSSNLLIQSIRVGTWVHLLIFQTHPTIRPRMFYRSGWLRCVGLICIGFMF